MSTTHESDPLLQRGENKVLGINIPPLPEPNIEIDSEFFERLPSPDDYYLGSLVNELAGVLPTGLIIRPPSKSSKVKADFAVNGHAVLRGSGPDAVNQIANDMRIIGGNRTEITVTGPFINIETDKSVMVGRVLEEVESLQDLYGMNNSGGGSKVILDVSSPNIAKSMHLGHLRSTVIGEALSRLLKANGFTTIRDNHLGDWGTQFGILAHAYRLWSHEIEELSNPSPESQVAGLQKLYVKINQAIAVEKEQSGEDQSELEDEGRKWFVRLEQGDEEAHSLWEWARDLSLDEFYKVYAVLGVDFEYLLGESEYVEMNEDIYMAMQYAGAAEYDETGKLCTVPSAKNIRPLTIRKSDGSSLYSTRELACLFARFHWFKPDKILYVVGSEQTDYFKQVFDSYSSVMGEDCPELRHIGFGAITLPEGRMSTRKGNVVFLEDVIAEAYTRALDQIGKNIESRGVQLESGELEEIARQVAVGAVIYFDLKQSAERKIVFDWSEILNFQGNSGPYLQYAHARINSIFESAESSGVNISDQAVNYDTLNLNEIEGDLAQHIAEFPRVVATAAAEYSTAQLSEYLYVLAHTFNKFYTECPVIGENEDNTRNFRLKLIKATGQVLRNGLDILNIPIPKTM
jgi:arginyl-tRNA synthetase